MKNSKVYERRLALAHYIEGITPWRADEDEDDNYSIDLSEHQLDTILAALRAPIAHEVIGWQWRVKTDDFWLSWYNGAGELDDFRNKYSSVIATGRIQIREIFTPKTPKEPT